MTLPEHVGLFLEKAYFKEFTHSESCSLTLIELTVYDYCRVHREVVEISSTDTRLCDAYKCMVKFGLSELLFYMILNATLSALIQITWPKVSVLANTLFYSKM